MKKKIVLALLAALLVAGLAGGVYAAVDYQPVRGDKLVGFGQLGVEPLESGCGYGVRGDFPTSSGGVPTPYDITPGMKIIYMTFSPAGMALMDALLAWAQVDHDDVEWISAANMEENVELLIGGKGDVAFGFPAVPPWHEAEASLHGIRWIELNAEADPEGADRFLGVYPDARFTQLWVGCLSAIGVWGFITPEGPPVLATSLYHSCFYFTNPDCVGQIIITRVSVIRDDGTVIYEGPYVTDGQIMTIMGPHETWFLALPGYMPGLSVQLPLASYTVEIAWEAEDKVCPLTGWQVSRNIDFIGGLRCETMSQSQMVNLEQELKLKD